MTLEMMNSHSQNLRLLFLQHLLVTDDVFFQYFEKFGKTVDSVVMYDKFTKRSRGFGFVTFEDSVSLYASLLRFSLDLLSTSLMLSSSFWGQPRLQRKL